MTARVSSGKDRRSGLAERRIRRFRTESRTRRIIRSSAASRRLRLTPRSRACRSSRTVSASTATLRGSPVRSRSTARRSVLFGMGHSRWQCTDAGKRASNRAKSCRCATSRTGGPAGYARTQRSRPTAARSLAAWSNVSQGASPRSTRPTSEPDNPTAAPSESWLTPAIRRAPRTSAPSTLVRCRPLRAPALITLSRTGMAGVSGPGFTEPLPGDLTLGAGLRANERLERGSSSAS
jgi:hypothetical protein